MGIEVTRTIKEKSRLSKEEWREYTKTVWSIANTSSKDHPAIFPVEIPHRLVKLFSFVGETVLDPFAGTGSTSVAAAKLGRKSISVDQNPRYVRVMKRRCEQELSDLREKSLVEIRTGDSRKLKFIKSDSVGLIVTSPPYWDKARYGGNGTNIGEIVSYRRFLEEMGVVFAECLRVLAPGRKFCIVTANVNQHTDHGLLSFPLAADFTMVARELGFVMVNELIWSKDGTGGRWGSANAQRPIFGSYPYPPNFLFKNVHEYILILAKPKAEKVHGPKVREYRQIMDTRLQA
jgi:site-specific DNA-methyltransferase (adenine-specific)